MTHANFKAHLPVNARLFRCIREKCVGHEASPCTSTDMWRERPQCPFPVLMDGSPSFRAYI